jgi:hypothetical protein
MKTAQTPAFLGRRCTRLSVLESGGVYILTYDGHEERGTAEQMAYAADNLVREAQGDLEVIDIDMHPHVAEIYNRLA